MFKLLALIFGALSVNEEVFLRDRIMENYNKYVRPVDEFENTLVVQMGLAIQNIESFDQLTETMDLNIWKRMSWQNDLLKWDNSSISFLSVDVNEIWTPDIELLNAAAKPEVYIINEALNLYNTGEIFQSKPSIIKFSCPLDLHEFPFDIQKCNMYFGSWTFNDKMLMLVPYDEIERQIDVLPSFSHSEWKMINYFINVFNESRICCPGKQFTVMQYTIELQKISSLLQTFDGNDYFPCDCKFYNYVDESEQCGVEREQQCLFH